MQLKLTPNYFNNINFKGIKSPYTDKNGNYITPISSCPNEGDIEKAIATVNSPFRKKAMEGCNGRAYNLGEDLVVKTYKRNEQDSSRVANRETSMLDILFNMGLKFPNSQVGCYAFQTPEGENYLVSTRVAGESPNPNAVNFNKENLSSLVDTIYNMDTCASSFSEGVGLRFMNYDFNGKNIKITPDKAGVFDFEYSNIEKIDDMINQKIIQDCVGINCHQSDTSPLPSSLRSFELRTLQDYLLKASNADELFDDYLLIKGKYHSKMSDFYNRYSKLSKYPKQVLSISEKEKAHSRLLTPDETGHVPKDIKKAEAIKMQMANFLHQESPFCATGKVNAEQLREYVEKALNHFYAGLSSAVKNADEDRITYYNDCLELFSSWRKVSMEVAYLTKYHDKCLMEKLTNKRMKTLDDVLNLD